MKSRTTRSYGCRATAPLAAGTAAARLRRIGQRARRVAFAPTPERTPAQLWLPLVRENDATSDSRILYGAVRFIFWRAR